MQCIRCEGEVVEVTITKKYTGKRSAMVCTKCGTIHSRYKMFRNAD